MSSPTSCRLFFPIPNISRPPLPVSRARLPAPRSRLAHLSFHPAVQDRFAQFPTVAEFKRGNLALGDVTVQGIRGDTQILRRLPHIHHFARFAHENDTPASG